VGLVMFFFKKSDDCRSLGIRWLFLS